MPAVGLFIVWEIGKLVARHYADGSEPGPDVTATVPSREASGVTRETGEPGTKLRRKEYEEELRRLQVDLVHMQRWIVDEKAKVCIVFEVGTPQARAVSLSGSPSG